MKRVLIFLLLGPASVVTAWLIFIAVIDGLMGSADFVAKALFIFTFLVAAITGPIDGYLARALPIYLRAPLTAVAGATIAVGLVLVVFTTIFSRTVPPEVVNGALCAGFFLLLPMGLCSLLSNDHGGGPVKPAGAHGSLS